MSEPATSAPGPKGLRPVVDDTGRIEQSVGVGQLLVGERAVLGLVVVDQTLEPEERDPVGGRLGQEGRDGQPLVLGGLLHFVEKVLVHGGGVLPGGHGRTLLPQSEGASLRSTTDATGCVATLDATAEGATAMLEITVTAVEESSVAALVAAGLDLDPSVPGVVPYFLR